MNRIFFLTFCSLFFKLILFAQMSNEIKGSILNSDTKIPLSEVNINIHNTSIFETSNKDGFFVLKNIPPGEKMIEISIENYKTRHLNVTVEANSSIDLGIIYLVRDYTYIEQNSG
ncbi:MAG: hypothetical protein HKN90_00825, partial [Flavobacteriaceae bacterium]|nr:hypothetical protein [Flavobacteriaceae bacterium]